ncbi:MAG TPA: PepSY domain-containing protein [Gemmatimonadaceae bacterium]|jgi:uncharacterized membrane protein YkoI
MHNRISTSLMAAALVAVAATSLSAQTAKVKVHYVYFVPMATTCNGAVVADEVKKVNINTEGYDPATMISPDSAKTIALCYVPGKIADGEIESNGTRTIYEISVLPNKKKTYSKVLIDAKTGEVLSTKQFGGARGLTGFLRESAARKRHKAKAG